MEATRPHLRKMSSASPPLCGPAASLPSERGAARRLQAALLDAFNRSPLFNEQSSSSPPAQVAHGLTEEWRLLDMCSKELVINLASRCLEWSEILEIIRSRYELMVWRANEALLGLATQQQQQQESARKSEGLGATQEDSKLYRDDGTLEACADAVTSDGRDEVEELREMLRAANERAARAEERAAIAEEQCAALVVMPAKVELQAMELKACKTLLDAQSKTLVDLRLRSQAAASELPAAPIPSSSTVIVLLPEPKQVPGAPLDRMASSAASASSAAPPSAAPQCKEEKEDLRGAATSCSDLASRSASSTAAKIVAEATASAIANAATRRSTSIAGAYTVGRVPSQNAHAGEHGSGSGRFVGSPPAQVTLEATAPGMVRVRICAW